MAARIENLSSSSVDIQLKDDYGIRSPYTITTGIKLLTVDGQDLQPFYHTFLKIYLSDLLSYDANNAQEVLIDPDAIINLDPNNIKHDVTILGVSGTYSGDIEPADIHYPTKADLINGYVKTPALIPGTSTPYDGIARFEFKSSLNLLKTDLGVLSPSLLTQVFSVDDSQSPYFLYFGFGSFSIRGMNLLSKLFDPILNKSTLSVSDVIINYDSVYDALNQVTVQAAPLQSISRTATLSDIQNGISITTPTNYYGIDSVAISNFTDLFEVVSNYSLNFKPSATVLDIISIPLDTTNYAAFASVSISRPTDLTALNIKHGITIAGIVGEYAGSDVIVADVTVNANDLSFASSNTYIVTPPLTPILYNGMALVTIMLPTNLDPANIKSGVTIAGIQGTYTNTNSGALSSDILSGKVAFVNGLQITGSLINDPYTISGSTLDFSLGNITYNTTAGHVTDTITVTTPLINPKDIIYGTTIIGIDGEFELPYFSIRDIADNTSISTSDKFYFDIVSADSTRILRNWLRTTTYISSQGISRSYTGFGNFYGINLYASGLSSSQGTYALALYDTGPLLDIIYTDAAIPSYSITTAGWQKSEVSPMYSFTFAGRHSFENDFDSYVDNFMSTSPAAFGPWISGGSVGSVTVTPSVNSLVILPALVLLDLFNEVDVEPIPRLDRDNSSGGYTVNIALDSSYVYLPVGIYDLKTSLNLHTLDINTRLQIDALTYLWYNSSGSPVTTMYPGLRIWHSTSGLGFGAGWVAVGVKYLNDSTAAVPFHSTYIAAAALDSSSSTTWTFGLGAYVLITSPCPITLSLKTAFDIFFVKRN